LLLQYSKDGSDLLHPSADFLPQRWCIAGWKADEINQNAGRAIAFLHHMHPEKSFRLA